MKKLKNSNGALPKRRKSKKKIAIALLLLAGIAFGAKSYMGGNDKNIISASEVGNLALEDLSSKVSANGEVIAEKDVSVYTTQTLPVKTILVKDNTFVQEGQILAYLDDKSLRKQIQVKEATLSTQAKNLAQQVAIAKDKYEVAQSLLNQGKTGTVLSAEAGVSSAKSTWEAAEKVYSDYKKSLEQGYNPETSAYQSTLESARQAVASARQTYDQLKERYKDSAKQNSESTSYNVTASKEREDLTLRQKKIQEEVAIKEKKYREELAQNAPIQEELARLDKERETAKSVLEEAERERDNAKIYGAADLQEKENKVIEKNRIFNEKAAAYNSYEASHRILKQAEEAYYAAQKKLIEVTNDLASAESDYSRTKSETETYDRAKITRKQELENAEFALKKAEENLKTIESQGESSGKSREDVLKTHRQSADTAKKAYEAALKNLELAEVQAKSEVKTLWDGLNTSRISASDKTGVIELAGMYRDLEDTIIRAPMSGTITHVYAKEGVAPSGALFEIEALDQLFAEVKVKTQDVTKIKPGMKVKVKRDGDDDHEFPGEVVSVGLSAEDTAAAAGSDSKSTSISTSKSPSFNVRVRLLGPQGSFLVGMKTRAEIILKEEKATFSVPLEAIIVQDDGSEAILTMDPGEKENEYTLRAIPVTTGVMTDTSIAIEGKDLKDGMQVLMQPKQYRGGEVVTMTTDIPGEEGNNG